MLVTTPTIPIHQVFNGISFACRNCFCRQICKIFYVFGASALAEERPRPLSDFIAFMRETLDHFCVCKGLRRAKKKFHRTRSEKVNEEKSWSSFQSRVKCVSFSRGCGKEKKREKRRKIFIRGCPCSHERIIAINVVNVSCSLDSCGVACCSSGNVIKSHFCGYQLSLHKSFSCR